MHAMGNSCGGMKLYTDLESKYELYQGGFIWDYIDQSMLRKNEQGEEVFAYGGEIGDDRATDYEFCTNGIVYADRKISESTGSKATLCECELDSGRKWSAYKNENLFIPQKLIHLSIV